LKVGKEYLNKNNRSFGFISIVTFGTSQLFGTEFPVLQISMDGKNKS
jgi:hypothetical protein